MKYRVTTQRELRSQFWIENPHASRRKCEAYEGSGTMYTTDTRMAFVDWIDALERDGAISPELAQRATL